MSETYGRYEVVEVLGKGGMGLVYLAHDPVLHRQLALKIIPLDAEIDEATRREFMQRFLVEARASAQLNHPSIVTVYDAGDNRGVPWIAFEYVEGESLEDVIRHHGPLSMSEAVRITRQIAAALERAHEREIVHRDIKPANILIERKTGLAKLADFGIAKAPWSTVTQEGMTVGSPGYMSPEQLKGLPLDKRSDLFSLGVMFYEMITGIHPFRRDTLEQTAMAILGELYPEPREKVPHIPAALEYTLAKCLCADREQRVESASALLHLLEDCEHDIHDTDTESSHASPTGQHSTQKTRMGSRVNAEPDNATGLSPDYRAGSDPFCGNIVEFSLVPARALFRTFSRLSGKLGTSQKFGLFLAAVVLLVVLTALIISQRITFLEQQVSHGTFEESVRAVDQLMKFPGDITTELLIKECEEHLASGNLENARLLAERLEQKERTRIAGLFLLLRCDLMANDPGLARTRIEALNKDDKGRALLKQKSELVWQALKPLLEKERASVDVISLITESLSDIDHLLFLDWVNSPHYWLRWNSVTVLKAGNFPVDMVNVYILDLQTAGNWRTRRDAAEKLGQLGDARAIPALEEAQNLAIRDPFVSRAARMALKKLR